MSLVTVVALWSRSVGWIQIEKVELLEKDMTQVLDVIFGPQDKDVLGFKGVNLFYVSSWRVGWSAELTSVDTFSDG